MFGPGVFAKVLNSEIFAILEGLSDAMATVELMLDDDLVAALWRRAGMDGVTFRDIVVHALETAVAVRDFLDQEPEIRPEGWTPLYDRPGLTVDELHMQMALKRKP
jgi:hypothetical protein